MLGDRYEDAQAAQGQPAECAARRVATVPVLDAPGVCDGSALPSGIGGEPTMVSAQRRAIQLRAGDRSPDRRALPGRQYHGCDGSQYVAYDVRHDILLLASDY